ncbi:MAG: hypothetical protein KGL48_04590 [Sphingomonadales bacterium]|nr:hypothetical protein [Sphingomonadales bacterium]MDE2567506.1 hypothetical protein [Sphingomonadales bacterium]
MANSKTAAPWHVWAVGVASLLWNLFPAVDYVLTRLKVASWLAQSPPEVIATVEAFPLWVSLAWGLGVWGSFFGAILILMRRSLAFLSFVISITGMAILNVYMASVGIPTPRPLLVSIVIGLLLEIYYCWRQSRSGVLR